jgi:hypothetical protein
MIEVREPEWKADGNLEIYVIKKNKEIYAEYQHDVIRIGLRLVMRANYPLTYIYNLSQTHPHIIRRGAENVGRQQVGADAAIATAQQEQLHHQRHSLMEREHRQETVRHRGVRNLFRHRGPERPHPQEVVQDLQEEVPLQLYHEVVQQEQ